MSFSKLGGDPELADPSSRKTAHCCPHCEKMLREAQQTDDGVRLCKECLLEVLSMPAGFCSNCEVKVQEGQYYPDRAAQREVNQLRVICPFKKIGCPWIGQLKDYESHIESCDYAGLPCPNVGCSVMLLSSQLDNHLTECEYRKVKCKYCETDMVAKDLETHHSECEMYPVECERCHEIIAHRNQLETHHLNHCQYEKCLICTDMVDRKTSKIVAYDGHTHTHKSTGETITYSLTPEKSTQDKQVKSSQRSPKLTAVKKSGSLKSTEKLTESSQSSGGIASPDPDEGFRASESDQFHLGPQPVLFRHMQMLASTQGALTTEFIAFKDSSEARFTELEETQQQTRGNVGISDSTQEVIRRMEEKMQSVSLEIERERSLRGDMEEKMEQLKRELQAAEQKAREAQQKAEQNSLDIVSVRKTAEKGSGFTGHGGAGVGKGRTGKGGGWEGPGNLEERVMMLERRTEQQERETSTLKVNVSELELQLQASLASTHNGSFLWRIPEVARRRRDAIEERITSIYSPPFYTGRNGYKMCIRAYLNGDGIGYKTHFSVFFVLMRGEFDPLLKWPFEYKVSLILVDQDHRKHIVQTFKPTPESTSFRRPQSDMNVASGCPQFSKLSVLDDESYTKNDVIYLKCIVDTSRIFHP